MQDSNQNTKSTTEMELISNIQLSGSLIAKNRETNAFISDVKDSSTGFIFAPSKKEVYDVDELKKARDLEVVELIPPDPETELDLVPREIYEEALEALAIAEDTLNIQSTTISVLENKIIELENEVERLTEEIDNEKLLRILAEENFENARQEIAVIIQESQLSYQRSILEGIEKTSLEAKNEGLIAQVEALKDELAALQSEIDQLTSEIQGKEAQIQAGAKAGLDITLLVKNKKVEDGPDLIYRQRNNDKVKEWINGPEVEVYNFTSNPLAVTIKQSGRGWIAVTGGSANNLLKTPYTFTLNANEKKTLTLKPDKDEYVPVRRDTEYRGNLVFTTTNGTTSITTALQKQVGANWSNNPKVEYN